MTGTATRMLRSLCCGLALAAAVPWAHALDAKREDVRQFREEMRRKHGFDGAWLDAVLADAKSQPRIIERISKPAETVMT